MHYTYSSIFNKKSILLTRPAVPSEYYFYPSANGYFMSEKRKANTAPAYFPNAEYYTFSSANTESNFKVDEW